MTQTLSLTPSTRPLGLDPVWRAATWTVQGATVSGVTIYRAQLWRRPQDATNAEISALATSYATIGSGLAAFTFTDDQMDFPLIAENGERDSVWLSIAGLRSGNQVEALRAGWLEMIEPGCRTDDFYDSEATFTVADGSVVVTFAGSGYRAPVEAVALPGGAEDGTYSVADGYVTFIHDGAAYRAPAEAVSTPSGLIAGGLLVLDGWLYLMPAAQAYRLPIEAV
jgi:hypothetical protein